MHGLSVYMLDVRYAVLLYTDRRIKPDRWIVWVQVNTSLDGLLLYCNVNVLYLIYSLQTTKESFPSPIAPPLSSLSEDQSSLLHKTLLLALRRCLPTSGLQKNRGRRQVLDSEHGLLTQRPIF